MIFRTKLPPVEPTRPLDSRAQFFFDHGPHSYHPSTETRAEGYTRCAETLAEAERIFLAALRDSDVGCDWAPDPDGFADYVSARRMSTKGIKRPKTIETATIWHRDDHEVVRCLASLSGIWDADVNYKAIVRAELALECLDDLRKLTRHPSI